MWVGGIMMMRRRKTSWGIVGEKAKGRGLPGAGGRGVCRACRRGVQRARGRGVQGARGRGIHRARGRGYRAGGRRGVDRARERGVQNPRRRHRMGGRTKNRITCPNFSVSLSFFVLSFRLFSLLVISILCLLSESLPCVWATYTCVFFD